MTKKAEIYSLSEHVIGPLLRTGYYLDPMSYIKKCFSQNFTHLIVDIGAISTLLFSIFLVTVDGVLINFSIGWSFYRLFVIISLQYDAFTHILKGKDSGRTITGYLFLGLMNILEYCFLFAALYRHNSLALFSSSEEITKWTDYIYFSIISQLTVGYGDIHPVSWGKLLVFLQGMLSLITILIYFTSVINFIDIAKQKTGKS